MPTIATRAEPNQKAPPTVSVKASDVLGDDEQTVGLVEKARAQQGAGEIEQSVGDGNADGEPGQIGRQRQIEARCVDAKGRETRREGDPTEGGVERRAHVWVLEPVALGVKSRRRESQPVEQQQLNDHRGRQRQHEAAIFGGAQKLRDQQADHEIQQAVHRKDKHHPHAERDSRDARRAKSASFFESAMLLDY